MDQFPHVVQAKFDEVFNKDYWLKGQWGKAFFKKEGPIVLELGCGKGEYTVGLARKFPEKNFIGIDIKGARMHTGASQSLKEGLENVGFIRTKIEMINSFFGENEVSEIWLTFPDPQMNRSRRRLTSVRFLNLYGKFLQPQGVIHLKTDSNFMYNYTKAVATNNELKIINDSPDLYNSTIQNEVLEIKTYYEKRFAEHKIPIKYLSFLLNNRNLLTEPEVDIPKDNYRNAGRRVRFYDDKNNLSENEI